MAYALEQFMKMSPEELIRRFNQPIGKCLYDKCGKIVTSLQQHRVVPGGVYHTGCYFEAWGDEIEQHPISSPRRGTGSSLFNQDLEVSTR